MRETLWVLATFASVLYAASVPLTADAFAPSDSNPLFTHPQHKQADGMAQTVTREESVIARGQAARVYGCTDPTSTLYNSAANFGDAIACVAGDRDAAIAVHTRQLQSSEIVGCTDPAGLNYDSTATL
eukprot:6178944-Pleurochrysis_carterae.AAC.2